VRHLAPGLLGAQRAHELLGVSRKTFGDLRARLHRQDLRRDVRDGTLALERLQKRVLFHGIPPHHQHVRTPVSFSRAHVVHGATAGISLYVNSEIQFRCSCHHVVA
jgi:hypothetical protein